MRQLIMLGFFTLIGINLNAQTADTIISGLKKINKTITQKDCNTNAAAISNRAMNVFLADKTSYLSGHIDDLSFYTNFVTLNSAEGRINVNHNVEEPSGKDVPIKTLFSLGASATLGTSLAATFLDKSYETEFGATLNYKWLGKVKTSFSNCTSNAGQKQAMDALRAGILYELEIKILKNDSAFKYSLNLIDTTEIPGQSIDSAKAIISRKFYADLQDKCQEQFAKQQAEMLTSTSNFKLITTSWTSINAYIPLVTPTYAVAQSYHISFQNKHAYPLDITISHTRLWESSASGRIFITLSGDFLLNNAKLSYGIDRTNYSDYKINGGTDTINISALKNSKAFIGDYQTFITPSIKGRFVYYPANTHFGIAFSLEQNFGKYKPLNGKITIPVILINSQKLPAVNVNFDVMFLDITNNYPAIKKSGGKTFIGVEVGIPLSRLMF